MRILEVWNKIDRFDSDERENLKNIAARRPPERPCFLVSAETGEGIDALLAAIEDRLAATRMTLDLSIDATDGAGISWLHRNSEVLNKELHDGRFDMTVRVDETKARHRGQPFRRRAARDVSGLVEAQFHALNAMKTAMAAIMRIIMIRNLAGLTRLAKRAPISVPNPKTYDQADDRQPWQLRALLHIKQGSRQRHRQRRDGEACGLRAVL